MLASLVGCRTPVITIKESPEKVGKTVYLTGKVVRLAPFLGNAAYQIEDATGKIWVVTTQIPQSNQQINIKGKVEYQSLPIAEQELGDFYLVELERLSSIPE
ncbi:MAG: hypothetical protein KME09_19900 [Pleurocapsa minor HA4230-MV1]|nr:hypothetical protein [Pleurocapsa minor HA4230-MV1]